LGNYEIALNHYNKSLELAKALNDKEGIAITQGNIADIYTKLGKHEKTLDFYEKSLKIWQELHEKKEISLLQKTQELQQLELTRQKNLKKSFFIVSLLVVILAFVIFTRYRLKIKVTRQLNKEIQEHKQTAAELLKSQKLESIGILAGGIAHDFNNLLTIIIGNISMAVEEIEGDARNARVVKMLKSAEKSSHEATELAQKLITFSMGGWIVPQKVALTTILKSVLEYYPQMEPLLKNTSIPPGLKSLYSDERQLRQVMYNLLQNANEAMTDPMKVTIKAENITINENNNFSLEPGDFVKISVIDNGRGIPADKLEKVFDPYFTTKDTVTRKGLGLGLAICYSIIRKHNGHIAFKSKVGKGTTVELYLPTYSETVNDNT
jgi:signal transduction histidine kinase